MNDINKRLDELERRSKIMEETIEDNFKNAKLQRGIGIVIILASLLVLDYLYKIQIDDYFVAIENLLIERKVIIP